MGERLTHFDEHGRAAIVDVTGKDVTERLAVAEGRVSMSDAAMALIRARGVKNGDVIRVAEVEGLMAAKKSADLIPLCHPLPLSSASVAIAETAAGDGLDVRATVKTAGRTGVEMEALTAVSVACLTIYDMLKSVDRAIRIEGIRLVEKNGGRSGHFKASGKSHVRR